MTMAGMDAFKDAYFEESEEHLMTYERILGSYDVQGHDRSKLDAVFRAIHSIKGGSGSFPEFDDITKITHDLEASMEPVRRGKLRLTATAVQSLQRAGDRLREAIALLKAKKPIPDGLVDQMIELCAGFPALCENAEATGKTAAQVREVRVAFFPDDADVQALLCALSELGGIVVHDRGGRQEADDGAHEFPWQLSLNTTLGDEAILARLRFMIPAFAVRVFGGGLKNIDQKDKTDDAAVRVVKDTEPMAGTNIANGLSDSIRVPVEKIDRLIDGVGAIAIQQAIIERAVLGDSANHDAPEDTARKFRDIMRAMIKVQNAAMAIRMTPVDAIFARYSRVAISLAGATGKSIEVRTEGAETELDKAMVERLADPLTHIIRNAIDHGIESPVDRVKAGKPEKGLIVLRAAQRPGSVIVEIQDDGRGLSREKVLAKAASLGWRADENMPDAELWAYVFEPGFSTAEAITEVSGRGVGMDVVKRNIQSLNGRVEIASQAGAGARITITLPLTLAIAPGLVVRAGNEKFVITMNCVAFMTRLKTAMLTTVLGEETIEIEQQPYRMVWLRKMMDIGGDLPQLTSCMAVVVRYAGEAAALVVDEVLAEQHVVVKSMANIVDMPYVAAITKMADGMFAFILNPEAVVSKQRIQHALAA